MRIYARPKRPTSAPAKVTSRTEFPYPGEGLSEADLTDCSWWDFKSQMRSKPQEENPSVPVTENTPREKGMPNLEDR